MQESQDQATDEYARALGDAQTRLAQKEAELRKAAENHASEAEQLRCRVEQESRDTHQVEANALREQLAQLEKGVEQEKAQNQELQTEQEKLLAQRDDVSSQLQEVNRANSRLLEQLTERGQEKDKLQQELEATRKTADQRKAMLDELAIDVAQEKSRHKEELSDVQLQHEKEVLGVRGRYEKELRGLHEDKNRTEEEIRSQLRDEKARTRELESLQQTVEELQAQIQSMEGTKGWFERGLKEAEETAEKSALEHQEQAQLTSRLRLASPEPVDNRISFAMEPPNIGTGSADPPNTSPTWASVVRGKRRVSIPLFPDPLADEDTLPLSNLFDSLAEFGGRRASPQLANFSDRDTPSTPRTVQGMLALLGLR
ncbi:hypothetical protein AAFF_G00095340 [Aldrovandia affinis]|uniref:Uncharacterized protein n=1 Tax=Aldrovandia affinis TaxID=143900 RepID=A0AAD7RVY4_9TELE|nr:hypothetical protein AAFF_G00095340 [Aldrovandia affinis]